MASLLALTACGDDSSPQGDEGSTGSSTGEPGTSSSGAVDDSTSSDGGSSESTGTPVATELRELRHDDGRGDTLVPGMEAGNAVAVRFSVPDGSSLRSVRFRVQDGNADTPFGLSVLAAAPDGSPGEALFPTDGMPMVVEPSLPPDLVGWAEVDLSAEDLEVPTELFVVMEWLTAPGPDLYGAQRLVIDLSEPSGNTWIRGATGWTPIADVPGFPAADAAIRATVEVPEGSLPPDPIVLSNLSPDCTWFETLSPEPGHEGALAVARIEADEAFALDFVRVQLAHLVPFGGECDLAMPFAVDLFRGTGALPEAEPDLVERFDIDLGTVQDVPVTRLDLVPTTEITLAAGEALFVAVHMERPSDESMVCIDVCIDPAVDTDGWSQASVPPYTWQPLTDFGISANYDVLLFGSPG